MTNVPQMSDIGRAISGKGGEQIQKTLNGYLTAQASKLEAQARRGLDKGAFEDNKAHIQALQSAGLILESIALYHRAQ
jgi:hypothetical protein